MLKGFMPQHTKDCSNTGVELHFKSAACTKLQTEMAT